MTIEIEQKKKKRDQGEDEDLVKECSYHVDSKNEARL